MRKVFLFYIFILIAQVSYADVFAEFGVAIEHPSGELFDSGAKNVEFGYQNGIKWGRFQGGLGGWTDDTEFPGTKPSAYIQGSLGLEPDLPYVYVNYFIGPAYVAKTDSILGSHWQVFQELGLGVKDMRGIRIGVVFKHLSNGGSIKPNKGRNFLNLRVQF